MVSERLRHSSCSITADTCTHLLEAVGRQAAETARPIVPRASVTIQDDDVVRDVQP